MKKFLALIVFIGCSVHASDSGTSSYDGTAVSSSDKHSAQSRRPGKKKKSNRGEGDILRDLLKEQRKTNKLLERNNNLLARILLANRPRGGHPLGTSISCTEWEEDKIYAKQILDKQ